MDLNRTFRRIVNQINIYLTVFFLTVEILFIMNWKTIKVVSQITGKPERTIRHKAAQGQIRVKRDGAKWLCDINSLKKLGWLPQTSESENLEKNPESAIIKNLTGTSATESAPSPIVAEKKKPHLLQNLGVYQELLTLIKKMKLQGTTIDQSAADHLLKSLHYIGLGFYDFQTLSKIANFSLARNHMVHALIHIQISEIPNDDYKNQIESTLLPGLGGLIRRMEKRKNGPEQRFSSSAKN